MVQPLSSGGDAAAASSSSAATEPARPLWESRAGFAPEDESAPLPPTPTQSAWGKERNEHAQLWEHYALAGALREDHGVDVAFAGPDAARPLQWTCNECAKRERGEPAIPSGRYCYRRFNGLIEHLRVKHDVLVY